jgi:copper chaperone CopZ
MTCSGCEAKVRKLLNGVQGVKNVGIDLAKGEAEVEMSTHVATEELKAALREYPKYQLAEMHVPAVEPVIGSGEVVPSVSESAAGSGGQGVGVYKPIFLLFGYITLISIVGAMAGGSFNIQYAMRIFMSGFFLSFSFFKLLDLTAFAESYAMYDIVARRWGAWGYVYAFIELGLGIAFAVNVLPFYTNWVTLVVMSVSIVGVLQSVFNKRKIKCACLGAVFNLPMSTVTIIEDALMIGMSAGALVMGL